MVKPTHYIIEYTLWPDAPSEDIWAEVQAQGGYIKFNAFGDVTVILDSRNPFNTMFALRWMDWVGRVKREAWVD